MNSSAVERPVTIVMIEDDEGHKEYPPCGRA